MPHPPENKEVVDAVMDGMLDARVLVEEAGKEASTVAKRMMHVARRVLSARAAGKMTAVTAKKLLRDAYRMLLLAEHVQIVGKVQAHVDEHMAKKLAAINRRGGLKGVGPIRTADIAARDAERKGLPPPKPETKAAAKPAAKKGPKGG